MSLKHWLNNIRKAYVCIIMLGKEAYYYYLRKEYVCEMKVTLERLELIKKTSYIWYS